MFERFTMAARLVVAGASEQARGLGHDHVGTEHLLLGLLGPDAGGSASLLGDAGLTRDGVRAAIARALGQPGVLSAQDTAALAAIGIDMAAVRARVEQSFGAGALGAPARSVRRPRFTPRAKQVLSLALREAVRLRHRQIATEHLLLGLLREGQGLAAQLMVEAGVDLVALRRATEESFRRAA